MGASEKVPPRGSSIPRLRDSSFSEQEARARPIVEIGRSHCIESTQNEQTVSTWTTVLTRLGATTAEDSRKAPEIAVVANLLAKHEDCEAEEASTPLRLVSEHS